MAQYKVPQDVEADDKFIGPLSFKQFVFGGLAAVTGYITVLLIMRNLWFLSPIFGLPMIVFGFLAFPWSKEQPTELWLAARIRFLIKPRKRIWDQTGLKELVEITVPKRAAHVYTDGLSNREVRSRMSALATMVDSRGWAIKNYTQGTVEPSDRLVEGNVQTQSAVTVTDNPDDVMDEDSGVLARQFENKIQESEQKHKSEARRLIEEARQSATTEQSAETTSKKPDNQAKKPSNKAEDFWFMHQQTTPTDPNLTTFSASPVIHPGESTQTVNNNMLNPKQPEKALDEAALLEQAHEKQRRDALQTARIKHYDPFAKKQEVLDAPQPPAGNPSNHMTTEKKPDTMKYVFNNDLNVETIQRQGHKKEDDHDDDEVVISLH